MLNRSKICLASIYAPNTFDIHFFDSIKSTLLNFSDTTLILGGDFNLLVNPNIDCTNPAPASRRISSSCISSFLEDLNVVDIWPLLHPSVKDYTFFSSRHSSFSRIDYFFVSPVLVKYTSSVTILPMLLSDHSPIIFSLENFSGSAKVKRWRFNTTLLQNKDFLTCIWEKVSEFIQHNFQSEVNPHILWESIKCHIRGVCISFSSHLNRTCRGKLEETVQEIGLLESQQKCSGRIYSFENPSKTL